ncbi:MAG: hypothetical protein ACYC8T_21020, partial [Myxococcaceae bacterium]
MTRWLWLVLALPAAAAAQDGGECEWKEMKKAPVFTEYMGSSVELIFQSDPKWWSCAKKSGGELLVEFNIGTGGELAPEPARKITTWRNRETLGSKEICRSGSGSKQVQAILVGKGPMERLSWTSTVIEVFCARCQWSGDDNMFVLHTSALTPPGTFTLDATLNPTW